MSAGRIALPASEKSQLHFNQIIELLTNGLVNFIACFSRDKKASQAFQLRFSTRLTPSIQLCTNFNIFGTLLIKANHPGIFKFTPEEEANLEKLGFMKKTTLEQLGFPQTVIDNYVHAFFRKDEVIAFTNTTVKEKYRALILKLIDTVYSIVEAATCSIECEQILIKYDRNDQLVVNKETQDPKFSVLDLQFSNGTGNLNQVLDSIIQAKGDAKTLILQPLFKAKTKILQPLFKANDKIKSLVATATTEYTKNISTTKETKLREESENHKRVADKHKREAGELKEALGSIQAEISQSNREVSEEGRDRTSSLSSLSVNNENSTSTQSSESKLAPTPEHTPPLTPEQKHQIATIAIRLQETDERISKEARDAKVDDTMLTDNLNSLITHSTSTSCTETSLLTGIVHWEKTAFAYLEGKVIPPTPKSLFVTFSLWSTQPNPARAIIKELKDILRQCIVLGENDGHLKEAVGLLNQHKLNISNNHSQTDLSREPVYAQLETLTTIITDVARERFQYPAKQTIMPSHSIQKQL